MRALGIIKFINLVDLSLVLITKHVHMYIYLDCLVHVGEYRRIDSKKKCMYTIRLVWPDVSI